MKPSIATTLIICGTIIASLPVIAHRFGLHIADTGAFAYVGLAAVMILGAMAGSSKNANAMNPVRASADSRVV